MAYEIFPEGGCSMGIFGGDTPAKAAARYYRSAGYAATPTGDRTVRVCGVPLAARVGSLRLENESGTDTVMVMHRYD